MARRKKKSLNIKLIVIITVAVLVPVVGGALYKFRGLIPRNHEKPYQQAVKLAAEGDLDGAAHQFQRAISFSNRRDPLSNMKYRIECAELFKQRLLNDSEISKEMTQRYLSTWLQHMETVRRMDPANEEACDALLDYWWSRRARGLGNPDIWSKILEALDVKQQQTPSDGEVFWKKSYVYASMAQSDEKYLEDAAIEASLAVFCNKNEPKYYNQWLGSAVSNQQAMYMPQSLAGGENSYNTVMEAIGRVHKAVVSGQSPSIDDKDAIFAVNPEDIVALASFYNPDSSNIKFTAMSLANLRQDSAAVERLFQEAVSAPIKNYEDHIAIAGRYIYLSSINKSNSQYYLELARQSYAAATELDSNKADSWLGLATIAAQQNQLEQSEEFVDTGLSVLEVSVPVPNIFDLQDVEMTSYRRHYLGLNILKAQLNLFNYTKEASEEKLSVVETVLEKIGKMLQYPLEQRRLPGSDLEYQVSDARMRAKLELIRDNGYAAEKIYRAIYNTVGVKDDASARQLIHLSIKHNQEADALRILKELLVQNPDDINLLLQQAKIQLAIRDAENLALSLDKLKMMNLSAAQAQTVKYLYSQWRIISGDDFTRPTMPDTLDPSQVTFWLDYADRLTAVGENEDARKIYTKLVKQFPGNPIVIRPLIVMMQKEGRTQQALELIDEQIAIKPDVKSLKLLRDILLAKESDRGRVHIAFLKAQDESAMQQMHLARAYRGLGDDENYVKHLRRVVELQPDYSGAFDSLFEFVLSRGDEAEIEKILQQAAEINIHGVDGEYYKAKKLLFEGKNLEVLDVIANVISKRGHFSLAYSLRGQAQFALKRYEQAKESFQLAWDLSNTNSTAMLAMAQIAEIQDMKSEHERWIYRGWQHLPMNPYIRYHWLRYQFEKVSPDQFINDCAVVARQYPDDPRVQQMLAKGYENITPAQLEKAENIYTDLYKSHIGQEDVFDYLQPLAIFLNKNGRTDEAMALCAEVRETIEDKVSVDLLCSRLYKDRNMAQESLGQIKKALETDPENEAALRYMGQFTLDTNSAWDDGIAAITKLREKPQKSKEEKDKLFESYVELLIRSGQLERARSELEQSLTNKGEDALTLAMLGQVCQGSREISKALDYYNRAINVDKNQVRARLLRAEIYRQQGRLQESMEDLKQAYELRPTESMAILYAQRAREAYPDGSMSRQILNESLIRHENSASLISTLGSVQLFMRDWASLESTLRRGREVRPRLAQWYILEAQMWDQRNQQGKRAAALSKARELAPNSPQVLLDYIAALIASGQSSSVADVIADVNTDIPQLQSRLQALFGQAQYKLGQQARGLSEIRSALLAAPAAAECEFVGSILISLLDTEATMSLLNTWHTEQPSIAIGIILSDMYIAAFDREKALSSLEAVDTSGLSDVFLFELSYRKASLQYELGNYQQAYELYSDALEIDETSVLVLNNLAYLLSDEMGRHAEALKYAKAASEAAPMDPNISDTLGWISHKSGDDDAAIAELKRSLELRPVPAAYYHLGLIYERQGDKYQADDYFSKGYDLVKNTPSDSFYKELKEKSGM